MEGGGAARWRSEVRLHLFARNPSYVLPFHDCRVVLFGGLSRRDPCPGCCYERSVWVIGGRKFIAVVVIDGLGL